LLRPHIRYADGYENISLGSDESDYDPMVGEKNYICFKLPEEPKKEMI